MATRKKKKPTFVPSGITPFDTGKVKMGINYQKPRYVEYDPDMLEIQKWMIGDPVKLRRDYWINVAYMAAVGLALLVVILQGSV